MDMAETLGDLSFICPAMAGATAGHTWHMGYGDIQAVFTRFNFAKTAAA